MKGNRLLPTYPRRCLRLTVLCALLLAIGGCVGITPHGQLRNNREEGPEKGLFSGPGGEFVILAPAGNNKEEGKTGETGTTTK